MPVVRALREAGIRSVLTTDPYVDLDPELKPLDEVIAGSGGDGKVVNDTIVPSSDSMTSVFGFASSALMAETRSATSAVSCCVSSW